MVIEFEKEYTPFTKVEMVAMFNSTRIDADTVSEYIAKGMAEHNEFIVVMFKSQYERLFDLEDTPNKEFYEDLMMEQKEQM